MIKSSNALLALWNGCSARADEYNTWHTREHVLERLTLPGFLSVRRYVKETGPLPDYLTLYWLSGREALESRAYLELLHSPSGWSRTMRNGLTDVLRQACVDVSHSGRGIGGSVLVKLVRYGPEITAAVSNLMQTSEGSAITSLTLGRFKPNFADLPFETASYDPPQEADAFIMLEGFDGPMLQNLSRDLEERSPTPHAAMPWTQYRLAFLAGHEDAVASGEASGVGSSASIWAGGRNAGAGRRTVGMLDLNNAHVTRSRANWSRHCHESAHDSNWNCSRDGQDQSWPS